MAVRHVNRRDFLRLSLGSGSLLLIAACAPSTSPPAKPAESKPAATAAPAKPAAAQPTAAPKAESKPAEAAKPAAEGKPAAAAKPGAGAIRVGVIRDITNMHPAQVALGPDRMMMANAYSGLVRFKFPTSEVVADLAERWEKSPDGRTYTFWLRKGVQFHKNYGELTSNDVKFTFNYHLDKENKSRIAGLFDSIETIETPDPATVVFKLKQPNISFLEILAWQNGYIMSEKATKELGDRLNTEPIGTGPFELTTWNKGQEVIFTRFDKYFGDKPTYNELRFKIIPEEVTLVLAVQKGEIDAANLNDLTAFRTAKQTRGIKVHEQPSTWVNTGLFNLKAGPTTNQKLRQALLYATDTKAISDASLGFQKHQVTFLNPFALGYTEDVPKYPYDQDKAKAMLTEAGYNNEPIRIVYNKTYQYEEISQVLKDSWTKVGVNAQLEKLDSAVYLQAAREGKFEIWITAVSRNTPDEYFSAYLRTGAGSNWGGYSNPEFDKLVIDARAQADEAKAKEMYARAQQILMTDVPLIPVSLQQGVWVTSEKVTNFQFDTYPFIADFQRATISA